MGGYELFLPRKPGSYEPEYKKILHAMHTLDKARWDLGDALVAECGGPDPTSTGYDGPGKLRSAWHYMRENGYDCTLEDLSELRRVAYVFRQSTRRTDISWDLHAESGTPEMDDRPSNPARSLVWCVCPRMASWPALETICARRSENLR
jgi:hypothetical protein